MIYVFRVGKHKIRRICVSEYQEICYSRCSTSRIALLQRGASVSRRRSEEKHTWPCQSARGCIPPTQNARLSHSISLCQSVATFFAFCAPSYLISYANPMCLDSTSIILFLISPAKVDILASTVLKVEGETQHLVESAASTK